MADCAAIKTKLDEAEAALHRVHLGGTVRRVRDLSGEEIEYNAANLANLKSYIALLTAQYAACLNGTGVAITRPVNPLF